MAASNSLHFTNCFTKLCELDAMPLDSGIVILDLKIGLFTKYQQYTYQQYNHCSGYISLGD